jgi:N-acetylated-alpha-linked acidic dipeptidase
MKLAEDLRAETHEGNRLLADKTLEWVIDPNQTFVPPSPKTAVPYFNFAPLQNAVERLRDAAHGFQEQLGKAEARGHGLSSEAQRKLDDLFMRSERVLTREEGLPGRPWYKHMIYAPGLYTGYSVKTLPAVREALEQRRWHEVNDQIEITAKVLEQFADHLGRARRIIGEAD